MGANPPPPTKNLKSGGLTGVQPPPPPPPPSKIQEGLRPQRPWLLLYIKRSFFIPNFIKVCIIMLVTCLKIFSGSFNTLYSKRAASKITSFYMKMTIFGIILRNI